MAEDELNPEKTGCLILFVPTIIAIDLVGTLASFLTPYSIAFAEFILAGVVGGAALGCYLYTRFKQSTKYSLAFWAILWGLIGVALASLVGTGIAMSLPRFHHFRV